MKSLLTTAATLLSLTSAALAAAQEAPKPSQQVRNEQSSPFRAYGYAGYTFTSVIRHGATGALVIAMPGSAGKEHRSGIQVTGTLGTRGFSVGAGWARCISSGNVPGCLYELRGVVGRARVATSRLAADEWYVGGEVGTVLVVLRVSVGMAFPVRESAWRHPMVIASVGFTPPVFTKRWFR